MTDQDQATSMQAEDEDKNEGVQLGDERVELPDEDSNIPVFCTADMPGDTLTKFFEELYLEPQEYREYTGLAVLVLHAEDVENLDDIWYSSRGPMAAFQSPFLGRTVLQLNDWFCRRIRGKSQFTHNCFAVLDERSAQDGSCNLVDAYPEFDPADDFTQLRVYPDSLLVMAVFPEIGRELGENIDRDGSPYGAYRHPL